MRTRKKNEAGASKVGLLLALIVILVAGLWEFDRMKAAEEESRDQSWMQQQSAMRSISSAASQLGLVNFKELREKAAGRNDLLDSLTDDGVIESIHYRFRIDHLAKGWVLYGWPDMEIKGAYCYRIFMWDGRLRGILEVGPGPDGKPVYVGTDRVPPQGDSSALDWRVARGPRQAQ